MLVYFVLVYFMFFAQHCGAYDVKCTIRGERCLFPFNYQGKEYSACTTVNSLSGVAWCPFRVGETGVQISPCSVCQGPSMCYTRADQLGGLSFTMYCPSSCSNVNSRLWGRPNTYSIDSYVCAAGIQMGKVRAPGRLITAATLPQRSPITLTGTNRNGVQSNAKVIPTKLMQISNPVASGSLPKMYYGHLSKIQVMPAGSNEPVLLIDGRKKVIALDVDIRRQTIYFSDVLKRQIVRAQLGTEPVPLSRQTVILDDYNLLLPDGLAIDWIHENLYWTDANLHQVMVSKNTGQQVLTLVKRGDEFKPRAIVLDPANGIMFVSDWGSSPSIEKCSMADGNTCRVIVGTNIAWPNGMSYDFQDRRLYWVDAQLHLFSSCRPDGSNRRTISTDQRLFKQPFGLSIVGNRAYWTDWKNKAVLSVDKLTGLKPRLIANEIAYGAGIKAINSANQPLGANSCSHNRCQFLCLASPGGYRCRCPDGFKPSTSDETRCVVAPTLPPAPGSQLEMLIADILLVRRLDYNFNIKRGVVTNIATNQRNAVALSSHIQNNKVYWSDVRSNTLMKSNIVNVTQATVYLQGNPQSPVLQHPDGIAVDWIHNNLYWSDYALHSVFVTKLTENFESSAKIIERTPFSLLRAIALHPGKGFMFISDWGNHPKIERCWMNGESCVDVANINMGWPNGITIDFESNRLYWADAKLKTITYSNFDGSGRTLLIQDPSILPHPYAIAIAYDKVYWSDWRLKTVIRADKNDGSDRFVVVKNLLKPMGLEIISEPAQPDFPNSCPPYACSHICVPVPDNDATTYNCVCPTHPANTDCVQGPSQIECPPGMKVNSLTSQCQDINECLENNGGCQQNCINNIGSYECGCRIGYELNSDNAHCTLTDPCESNPCKNGGTCTTINQVEASCSCARGFGETDCSTINGTIIQSINPIPSGSSFLLECRVPDSVSSNIIWRRNRKLIKNGREQSVLTYKGRQLTVLRATYLLAGEYTCQFRYNGREIVVTHMVAIEVPVQTICGQAPGINEDSRKRNGRIFGGSVSQPLTAPFMAFLYKHQSEPTIVPMGLFCGASIITKNKVVTAAHCVEHLLPHQFKVYVGKLKASVELVEKYQQVLDVSRITLFPDFNSVSYNGDIAILELASPIVFTIGVKPICVPGIENEEEDLKPRPSKTSVLKRGMIFGWGLKSAKSTTRSLREVVLPIRPMTYCHEAIESVTSLMFCAGGGTIQDACNGDSGGPFALWSSRYRKWSIAGIISWGEGCGNPEKPGIYTRIGKKIRAWLYSNADFLS